MDRTKSIGGSDALKIMRGDWSSLWLEKTGRTQPEDLSNVFAVQLGVATEDFNIRWFARDMGVEITGKQTQYQGRSAHGVPLRATLDAEFMYEGQRCVLEVKHTYEGNTLSKQVANYMPQLQLYMHMAAVPFIYFANIFGNRRYEYCKVSWDKHYYDTMMVNINEFWSLVQSDTAPPNAVHIPSIGIDHIELDDMVARCADGDNMFLDQAHQFIETIEAHSMHESAKKTLKAMVANNEREVYSQPLTIKRSKNGALRFNINKDGTTE